VSTPRDSGLRATGEWALLAGVILSFFLLRIPTWPLLWNGDEAVSMTVAHAILDGGVPYRDGVDHRGPLTYYLYAAVLRVAGRFDVTALHAAFAVLVAGITWAVHGCTRRAFGARAAAFASLAFAIMAYTVGRPADAFAFHTEWPLIAFTTAGAWLCITSTDRDDTRLLWLSGACYAIAASSKQVALLDAAAGGTFVVLGLAARRRPRAALRAGAAMVGGFALLLGALLGYFAIRHALGDFVTWFWTYNTKVYMATIGWHDRVQSLGKTFRSISLGFPVVTALVAAVLPWNLAAIVRSLRGEPARLPPETLFLGWLVSALVGASVSARDFGHYYVQTLPPLAILSGAAVDRLLAWLAPLLSRWKPSLEAERVGTWASVVLAVVLVVTSVGPLERRWSSRAGHRWDPDQRAVGETILSATRPDDPIFVWGMASKIYIYARRECATRFSFTNALTGYVPGVGDAAGSNGRILPGAWDALIADLARRPPAIIVDTSPGDISHYGSYPIAQFPRLAELVSSRYEPATELLPAELRNTFHLFRRRDTPPGSAAP